MPIAWCLARRLNSLCAALRLRRFGERQSGMRSFLVAVVLGCFCLGGLAQTVSPLLVRGYTVIPQPQKVSLEKEDFSFGEGWRLRLEPGARSEERCVGKESRSRWSPYYSKNKVADG